MLAKQMKCNEAELDRVVGGTVAELDELVQTISVCKCLGKAAGLASHIPGMNETAVQTVESILSGIGIDADISTGLMGSGIGSKPNKYTFIATGQSMTHGQVIDYIKRFKSRNGFVDF